MAAFDLRKIWGAGFNLPRQTKEMIITRVVITEADQFVVPAHIEAFKIQRGQAWVSYQSVNFFLYRGQQLRLTQGQTTVITASGRKPVTIDLYSQKRR